MENSFNGIVTFDKKLAEEKIKKIENLVNQINDEINSLKDCVKITFQNS